MAARRRDVPAGLENWFIRLEDSGLLPERLDEFAGRSESMRKSHPGSSEDGGAVMVQGISPGWYPDPHNGDRVRWWDGHGWSAMNEPWIVSSTGREILRTMIEQENQLRNQRLGYLLTLNGLLFAALGFAWDAAHALSLVVVLALMGISVAAVGLAAMLLSDRAIRYLRLRGPTHRERLGEHGFTVDEKAELESIPVALTKQQIDEALDQVTIQWDIGRILQPWHSLPMVLGGAWLAILIVGLFVL
jgi:hypothetical protein